MLDFGKWRSKFFKYGPCDTSFFNRPNVSNHLRCSFLVEQNQKEGKTEKKQTSPKIKSEKSKSPQHV